MKALTKVGVDPAHAEAITDTVRDAVAEGVVTKVDIARLETRMLKIAIGGRRRQYRPHCRAHQAASVGRAMTAFETASLIIAGANATAAAGIWHGIRAMVRANKERAVILDPQREADERRHTEAMAAFNELIRAGRRQGEVLEHQGSALDELLRRPAPAPAE